METGKTGKYFKYAIGEIILVVIGILIALQINNWNENKTNKQTEHIFYSDVLTDLKKDSIRLKDQEQFYKSRIKNLTWHLEQIRNPDLNPSISEFGKRIEPLYYSEVPLSYNSTLDSYKNSGSFDDFKNKNLLQSLTFYYSEFNVLKGLITSALRIIENQLEPIMSNLPKSYVNLESGNNVIAETGNSDFYLHLNNIIDKRNLVIDIKSFIQNPKFESYIIGDIGRSFNGIDILKNRIKRLETLKKKIEDYLDE